MINRSETWRRFRDFFASGGEIAAPTIGYGDITFDAPDPLSMLPKVTWREIGTAEERSFAALRDKLISGIPLEMGVDLATGGSETWLMYWDWDEGKIIYRKIDPADMVRRDDGEEGIPNGEH